jgi:hypothetical protein
MYPDLSTATWRKSVHSGGEGGNCVEVAITDKVIGVRDSKNTAGGVLVFNSAAALAFLESVKGDRLGR